MISLRSLTAVIGTIGIVSLNALVTPPVFASAQASISIQQVSPTLLGTWTFFPPDNVTKSSNDKGVDPKNTSFTITNFGPITFSVKVPAGMRSIISIYRNGTFVRSITTTQVNVNVFPNDSYRFLVSYSFSNVGTFGVTSTPARTQVTLKGPDGYIATAITPHTFINLPAGKYTITAAATGTCSASPQYNRNVEEGKRVTIHIDLPCGDTSTTTTAVNTRRKSKRQIRQEAELREALRAAAKKEAEIKAAK